jgi:hypothetical protein
MAFLEMMELWLTSETYKTYKSARLRATGFGESWHAAGRKPTAAGVESTWFRVAEAAELIVVGPPARHASSAQKGGAIGLKAGSIRPISPQLTDRLPIQPRVG